MASSRDHGVYACCMQVAKAVLQRSGLLLQTSDYAIRSILTMPSRRCCLSDTWHVDLWCSAVAALINWQCFCHRDLWEDETFMNIATCDGSQTPSQMSMFIEASSSHRS